jgi:hypothetical protein
MHLSASNVSRRHVLVCAVVAVTCVSLPAGFRAGARFNANAVSGQLEGGYRCLTPWAGGIGIAPYAAAQFTTFMLPGYGEQAIVGANNFALNYAARSRAHQ